MDVDNSGPFVKEWENVIPPPVLDLVQPLYLGGVPDYNQLPAKLAGVNGFVHFAIMRTLFWFNLFVLDSIIHWFQTNAFCIQCPQFDNALIIAGGRIARHIRIIKSSEPFFFFLWVVLTIK